MKTTIKLSTALLAIFLCSIHLAKAQDESNIKELFRFDEIRISPLIEVILEEGEEETIEILESKVSERNLRHEVSGGVLRVYLRGAKVFPGDNYVREERKDDYYMRIQETQAKVKITYRHLEKLTVKGDEDITFNSPWKGKHLTLKAYGDTKVMVPEVDAKTIKVSLYGDNTLLIKSGQADKQRFNMYGDSEVDVQEVDGYIAIVHVFGDNDLQLNAKDELRLFGFGDSDIQVRGNPLIRNGLRLGDIDIEKVD